MNYASPESLLQGILVSLDSIAGLDRIWKTGVVHRGGPHFRLTGTVGPVSIGEDECLLLGQLIGHLKPETSFTIGNGFGLGSAFVAKMMEANGGASVTTLDNKLEGDGERCFQTAEQLRVRMECRLLENKYGVSPRDIPEDGRYDLIFIDGDHSHPQVTEDFRAVQHLVTPRGILCWHDYWLDGVAESVAEAQRSGFHCVKVNSSCEMVFGTKDEEIFRELQALFQNTGTLVRRRHPLARLKLTQAFLWAKMNAR